MCDEFIHPGLVSDPRLSRRGFGLMTAARRRALAAEWVNVGGTQYDAGTAAGDEAGTWSWDGANDMKLNGYDGGSIGAKGNLTIGVTGTNTVTADAGQSAIAV